MLFNRIGEEIPQAPVTLPTLRLRPAGNDEAEIAARFAEQRTIRAGIDAWQAITKAESFESWKTIGKALQVGRDLAMKSTGANAPMGRRYSTVFCDWIKQHHFDRMPKSTRSVALELNEHLSEIESWRASLTDKERRRLTHPLSNVRRWRAATAQPRSADGVAKTAAAWSRFVACVEALPPDVALPFWRDAQAALSCNLDKINPIF